MRHSTEVEVDAREKRQCSGEYILVLAFTLIEAGAG
jgi:hypothetical protein